ncbi:VTC domain-containing protein [Mycotypha africana]|uniref:VTC domain-containing protein n=1 Tax=Mycotypha africana TaxID=64632 RepID=UPI002300E24E|nr:VTC domain-containing protein [Mycotypha africana]KAI8988489.1 VTC domain-containing protein [Mycotypha africana]
MTIQAFEDEKYKPWSEEYIAYGAILRGLTSICQSGHWTEKDEDGFESAIRVEAGKVNIFIIRKQRELETRFAYCQRIVARAQTDSISNWRSSTSQTLKEILAELVELNRYVRNNFKALEHLVQEHRKWTDTNLWSLFVEICRDRALDNQRFDDLFVNVCSLIDNLKRKEERSILADKSDTKQEMQFVSARFWVHKDNITEVKVILLFHMPMQIVASDDTYFEQSEHSRSVIYLDNDDFQQYTGALEFDDAAESISVSWCNDIDLTNSISVYRTALRSADGDDGGPTSDQIMLGKSRIVGFLTGTYSTDSLAEDLRTDGYAQEYIDGSCRTAQQIQTSITNKRLKPKALVQMNRFLFLSPEDAAFSVSLNTDLKYTQLDGAEMEWSHLFHGGSSSASASFSSRASQSNEGRQHYTFPYALLETQFHTRLDGNIPQWLLELSEAKLIYEVPRFTLFVDSVAQLWRPQLAILPWWLDMMDQDIRRAEQDKRKMKGEQALVSRTDTAQAVNVHRVGYLESRLRRPRLFEPTPCAASTMAKEEDARSHRSSEDSSEQQSMFLDYYYSGRAGNSPAYLLQRVESVKKDDQLRKEAIIQIEEEEKRIKKEKKKKKKKGQMLEPKIFFANERVFLKYLQFSALIMTAALTLLNFGDYISTIAGATFFGISTVIVIYSTFRYRLRSYQIKTFPGVRYDDRFGPVGLCALLVGAMVLNFVLRWEHPSATATYLGTNQQTGQQSNQQT